MQFMKNKDRSFQWRKNFFNWRMADYFFKSTYTNTVEILSFKPSVTSQILVACES